MTVEMLVAVVAYSLSAMGFVAFGASFGLRGEWGPWHGAAVGKKWSELGREMLIVIISIMRAAGAGGIALAVTTGLLMYRLAAGDFFARAALAVAALTF